eukprot:COSAG02_NODE_4729_length_5044_cov_2.301517_2_plen_85_part_00
MTTSAADVASVFHAMEVTAAAAIAEGNLETMNRYKARRRCSETNAQRYLGKQNAFFYHGGDVETWSGSVGVHDTALLVVTKETV